MSPESRPARLATPRTLREQITVRSAPLIARFGATRRLEAYQALCADAHRKPGWLYDAQRTDIRRTLPDEREHEVLQEGIHAGYITAKHLADYFAEKFLIHLASIPGVRDGDDVTFCVAAREACEALEAIALARSLPTKENRSNAVREVMQAVVALQGHGVTLQQQGAA